MHVMHTAESESSVRCTSQSQTPRQDSHNGVFENFFLDSLVGSTSQSFFKLKYSILSKLKSNSNWLKLFTLTPHCIVIIPYYGRRSLWSNILEKLKPSSKLSLFIWGPDGSNHEKKRPKISWHTFFKSYNKATLALHTFSFQFLEISHYSWK